MDDDFLVGIEIEEVLEGVSELLSDEDKTLIWINLREKLEKTFKERKGFPKMPYLTIKSNESFEMTILAFLESWKPVAKGKGSKQKLHKKKFAKTC